MMCRGVGFPSSRRDLARRRKVARVQARASARGTVALRRGMGRIVGVVEVGSPSSRTVRNVVSRCSPIARADNDSPDGWSVAEDRYAGRHLTEGIGRTAIREEHPLTVVGRMLCRVVVRCSHWEVVGSAYPALDGLDVVRGGSMANKGNEVVACASGLEAPMIGSMVEVSDKAAGLVRVCSLESSWVRE